MENYDAKLQVATRWCANCDSQSLATVLSLNDLGASFWNRKIESLTRFRYWESFPKENINEPYLTWNFIITIKGKQQSG
jgi:hypothetical protein